MQLSQGIRSQEPYLHVGRPEYGGIRFLRSHVEAVKSVLEFIEKEIPAREAFAVFPPHENHNLYFVTGKTPPQPATWGGEMRKEDQDEIISALEKNKTGWIFLWGNQRPEAVFGDLSRLKDYVLTRFWPGRRIAGEVLVLRRSDGLPNPSP